jgi:uroporphyrinogen decarboxylase
MNPKDNLLSSIYFEDPHHVPRGDESITREFEFEGNFQMGDWSDRWGVRWKITRPDMVLFPKGNPLPDLGQVEGYDFPDANQLEFTEEHRKFIEGTDRNAHLVHGVLTYFMFERAWALMGMDNLMINFFTHPKELKGLLHKIADFNIRVFERYVEIGIDGVGFSEDLGHQGGLMISPKIFREFFIPEYERCFEPLIKEGKIIEFHSCGCIQDIVEDLAELGITILNPVQARANNLALVKERCLGKMALKGSVDSHLLMLGPAERIRVEAKRVVDILAPGGGYIIGPDQGMPFPRENVEALWAISKSYGTYPQSF